MTTLFRIFSLERNSGNDFDIIDALISHVKKKSNLKEVLNEALYQYFMKIFLLTIC